MADAAKTIIRDDDSFGDGPTQLLRGEKAGPGRGQGENAESAVSFDYGESETFASATFHDDGAPPEFELLESPEPVQDASLAEDGEGLQLEFGFAGGLQDEPASAALGDFDVPPLPAVPDGDGDLKFSSAGPVELTGFDEGQIPGQGLVLETSASEVGASESEGLASDPFRVDADAGIPPPPPVAQIEAPPESSGPWAHDAFAQPLSDAMVPPPDVKPPSETKGNRIAFLFNAYQNVAKVAVAVVASIALFIFVAPFVLGEAQLRALAQVFGVETLFVELRLIPEHDPSLLANNLPQQSEADLPPAPPNQDYFTSISEALRMGEIERSAVLMKAAPPKKLESEFDLNQVASLSARFYLAVGKDEQALRAASARCGGDGRRGEGLVSTCLPLARSYIGLGRFQEASTVLDNLEAASDAEGYATQLGFARAALKVGLDASPRALADHIFVFLQPISMDVEWERQIAKWILRDFGRIGHRRWRDVAQILFKLERAKVAEAMGRVAVESGRYSYAVGLTRFLDFLALRYGYPVLGFKHGSGRLLVNDTRVSITLQAIASNMAADERNIVGNRLQVLRGKRPFAEVERLIAVNLALQEKNWNKAFQILNGQIENIPNSRFSFEWKLAGAAFAIGSNNLGMAGQLEQALTLYGAKVPKVKEIFDYWYTLARLRLRVQRAAGDAVARASLLADSEREQGLVAALKLSNVGAREERGMGELESIVQRYPWHDSVLEAAILASGRRGQDPSRYMAMQNRLTPIRLAAGREKNLLLDTTVEELLRLL